MPVGRDGIEGNVLMRWLLRDVHPVHDTRRAQVGNRIIKKRFHARVEHVQQSRCREEFLKRRASNDVMKAEAKQRGERIKEALKRQPKGPRDGFMLKNVKMETITAIPYDIVKEGIQT